MSEDDICESGTKIYGTVACPALNVRASDNVDSEVLCVIKRGAKVEIDMDRSSKFFYSVFTEAGIRGYCMKKFIKRVR